MTLDQLFELPQYSLRQQEKESVLLDQLNSLTRHHYENCPGFRKLSRLMFDDTAPDQARSLGGLPYLPVGLFKRHALSSIPESEVFKILESSGTTGQTPSRIVLDRHTAQLQTMALSRIMTHILGPRRIPMILVETADLIKDRRQFNARAAGLLGMMNFGRDHFYALDSDLELRTPELEQFLLKHGGQPFLIFGFTFLVWSKFYRRLEGNGLDLSKGILVHSGGWKKLIDEAVSPRVFRESFRETTGLNRSYNFYGMVEQVGGVFLEGEDGYLYPPNFADIIIRDPITLAELPPGGTGLIEVLSVLPRSYPGQCLLTEDLGVVRAVDSPACGRMGKAFEVLGRIPRAELRGCSDVIAAQVSG